MIRLGGGGQMSPDGRLILTGWATELWTGGWTQNTWTDPSTNVTSYYPPLPGWAVQVVRPELITRSSTYQPVLASNVFDPPGGYLLEPGADIGVNEYTNTNSSAWMTHQNATYGDDFITNSAFFNLHPLVRTGTFPGMVPSGITNKRHSTWFPNPVLDTEPVNHQIPPTNPYACTVDGVPIAGFPAPQTSQYVAYQMIVVVFSDELVLQQNPTHWHFDTTTPDSRTKMVPVKVVVSNPYTASATVAKAWVTGRYQDMKWGGPTTNNLVRLAEISITKDGHFMVGQGHMPVLDAQGNNHFPDPVTYPSEDYFTFHSVLWATWNTNPGSATGWHEPVLLSELYLPQNANFTLKTVNGVNIPLKDVIRLARHQMRYQNGDGIGNTLVYQNPPPLPRYRDGSMGAYPWVHWDGDGIMHPIGGPRGTIAYCGVQTNWTYATLDAANISHLCELAEEHGHSDEEHVMGGLMAMSGMWDMYRDTGLKAGGAILGAHPVYPREPVFSFIHGQHQPHQKLTTMSFEDWSDGEYQVFLHMTPLISRIDQMEDLQPQPPTYLPGLLYHTSTRHELGQTTDTSGNYHTALLLPNAPSTDPMQHTVPDTHAAFTVGTDNLRNHDLVVPHRVLPYYRPAFDDVPGDTYGQVSGRIGEAIRLGSAGYVDITNGPWTPGKTTSMASADVSVEAFVKVTSEFLALSRSQTNDTQLFYHSGRLKVGITYQNKLSVSVLDPNLNTWVGHTTPSPVFTQPVWYHIAVVVGGGNSTVYVDGVTVATQQLISDGGLGFSTNHFQIGPAGTVGGGSAIMMYVDEFRLSRIARTADEIARHAFVEQDKQWEQTQLPPLSNSAITAADCRVDPSRPWTSAKSAFGSYVFSNPNLSLNKNYSCASCHQPSKNFTDGLALAVGHAQGQLNVSTPTLFDSITGVEMFWDMRAANLNQQVTQPITTPVELGFSNLNTVLTRLNADLTAVSLHQAAFSNNQTVTATTLAQGLESYVQSLVSPTNAVDAYTASIGGASALTLQEKRGRDLFLGKARCISCHYGPSFTDHLPHNTGAATTGQNGRQVYTQRAKDLGAFKTPTLRHIAGSDGTATAPFFHDGFAGTLNNVVDFYDLGGGASGANAISAGRAAIGTTHIDMLRLGLTPQEKADLIAFLLQLGS
jgi:cytochrome c peroxidase